MAQPNPAVAPDKLIERARFFEAVVDSADDAIVTKTLQGRITSWNRGAERLFGYKPDEVIGLSITVLIPRELWPEEEMILGRITQGQRVENYETTRVRKNGSKLPVSLTISPVRDGAGQIIGASKIARDISERKRAEALQAELLDRERVARQEAQIILELGKVISAELDLNKVVQKVTDAGRELTHARFGAFFYNTENDQGEVYQLFTLSGASRAAFENFGMPRNTALFGPTFRGEAVVRLDDVLQDPRYGKSPPHHGMPEGHLPVRSYLAVPVLARSGEVLGGLFYGHPDPAVFDERAERLVTAVAAQASVALDNAHLYQRSLREVEERRKSEESERAARTAAERAARLRDEFLATVSHELRTPLNGMLGWTQILRMKPDDPKAQRQAAEAIERSCRTQVRLIEDLLDMSRIISGKLRLDVQTVEVGPILRAALETVQPAADAKDIHITSVLDPLAGPVKGDPTRLQQIFWNLLSNAVKFTPKGGKVQVCLERVNSHIEVSVSDTGQGIAPEFLPHVFDRFSQADSSTTRRHGGLGLGLAVVKHLVELHGGKVWAKSPGEGKGATFSVHLPMTIFLQDKEGREHPATPKDTGSFCGDSDLTGIRVLVVDDDPDTCEVLQRFLEECKAEVTKVHSGLAALEIVETWTPHALVSDIGMPEMDGYALIREVRSRGHRMPAVAVTAFARADDRIRVLQAGYNMHVAKPLEPRELIAVIEALVRPASKS